MWLLSLGPIVYYSQRGAKYLDSCSTLSISGKALPQTEVELCLQAKLVFGLTEAPCTVRKRRRGRETHVSVKQSEKCEEKSRRNASGRGPCHVLYRSPKFKATRGLPRPRHNALFEMICPASRLAKRSFSSQSLIVICAMPCFAPH